MSTNYLHRQLTLGERLARLPLSELAELQRFFGIETLNKPGNVASWSLYAQINFNLLDRSAELGAALASIEQRLGLQSPTFYPWPLHISIRTETRCDKEGAHTLMTSPDLSGLLTFRHSSVDEVRVMALELLLLTYGLDIDAIERDDNMSEGFKALVLDFDEWAITFDDEDGYRAALAAIEAVRTND